MFKTLILLSIVALSFSVNATENNLYDQMMAQCMDEINEVQSCHRNVMSSVLSDFQRSSDYLSCIDYGHSTISFEKEVECLREITLL